MPDRRDFVTDHAMTSPEEDAAETYAAYNTHTIVLWKRAIDQKSDVLMQKARAIEPLATKDGKTFFRCEKVDFSVPVESVQTFFGRACDLIRLSIPVSEIEGTLRADFSQFVTQTRAADPLRAHRVLRRLRVATVANVATLAVVLVLLFAGSMVYVAGIRTWYTLAVIGAFLLLMPLRLYRDHLDNMYSGTYYFRMEGLHVGMLLLLVAGSWLGGWLLANGHTLAFRFIACVPAISLATSGAKWLLNAPDSRDKRGRLKFGTRSALIGLYLALLGFAFSVASAMVSELPKK